MVSTEARLMHALEKIRSMEGALAVLQHERQGARTAVSEAAAALEHVSFVLSGDHLRAATQAAHQCQRWLEHSHRIHV